VSEETGEETGKDTVQRFLVDLMLMRLGRWLRLLGQDVANLQNTRDNQLMLQAKNERRIIITIDLRPFLISTICICCVNRPKLI
jgi:uncharacterized protein with PIN domain